MSIRTIEAPGVQINEIDKSGYTPSMTGTRCYIMGYANRGEPYQVQEFTSKASWQNYYGDPDNEAERYFYNACSEVINHNGVLYCARLPYDNAAKDKMVGYKYTVTNNTNHIYTAGDYLTLDGGMKSWIDHDNDFEQDALNFVINNKCYREIDGNYENGLEQEKEIKQFYNAVIKRFNETYNRKIEYKRWSVSYYETDSEKSSSLSARFATEYEAREYLYNLSKQSVKQKYYYNTNYSCDDIISGLLYENGDWIALPLYCVYNKEATIKDNYTYGSSIETVGDIRSKTFDLISCTENKEITVDGIVISQYNQLSTVNLVEKSVVALYNDPIVSGYTTLGDIATTLNIASCDNNKKDSGLEISSMAYASWRANKLRNETTTIDYIQLYDDIGTKINKKMTITVPKYCRETYWNDGADNEIMFNNVVSSLYYDNLMKGPDGSLSIYIVDEKGIVINDFFDKELWKPYHNKTLSSILRESANEDSGYISSWGQMLDTFKKEGGIKYSTLIEKYGAEKGDYQERINLEVPNYEIIDTDQTMDEYLTIIPSQCPVSADLAKVDEYRTGEDTVGANTFWIFDKTCATLNKVPEDKRKGDEREMIGIFPVITTAANALYAQSLIQVPDANVKNYENVIGAITKKYDDEHSNELSSSDISMQFSQLTKKEDDGVIDTVSRDANNYFLPIQMNSELTGFDTENMKKIGVVVYKAFLDASEGNKVSFQVVESFCGSLDKNAKNPNTGVSQFIDKIVNTQSEYIYFFSNCFVNTATQKQLTKADFFKCEKGNAGMLGWFSKETVETISLPGLYQGIDKCFKNVEDINERDIDIIPDAGLANIAQYMKSVYDGSGAHAYDLEAVDEGGNPLIKNWKCQSASDVNAWKTVQFKLDNFCKNVRKDCMFIADGPRPIVLAGNKKIVRASKPTNTIDANILPYVKYATGLNTNYGAGYLDWFQITDEFTGDEFWCPPSIKAMGVYIYTDLNFEYWDAPAGLNRGMVQALDVAFSPTVKQAGPIYQKNWNYAINYPYDGIVLEGQKTFQVKPSAFDRVNVRRLFLRLERQTRKVARYFVFEGNTSYTRQRLIDMLNPIFYQAKVGGGIYDYKIICDESNNTPTVIDNNELRVKIGIKPVKTAEFILIDFIALPTGGSFSEI